MAAFTSKASGNWSSSGQTTWNEVGVPGNGDTVTIGTGHAIVVDVNTTVGTSDVAGTTVVTVTATGTLAIATGVVFTVRGDCVIGNTTLTLAAGSTYTFDSSLAAGTPIYKLQIGSTGSQTSAKLVCNGTSGSHCTIAKAVGSGNGAITYAGGAAVNQLHAAYTDFLDLGAASIGAGNDAVFISCPATGEYYVDHCTFTRCGRVMCNSIPAAANLTFTSNSFSGHINSSQYLAWFLGTAPSTGTRNITDNVFHDGNGVVVFSSSAAGLVLERNVFAFIIYSSLGSSAGTASCADNLFYNRNAGLGGSNWGTLGATASRTYYCSGQMNTSDNTGITDFAFTGTGTITYDGYIYETTNNREDDDAFHLGGPSAANTIVITHGLVLPNSRGRTSGCYTAHGNANTTSQFDHCTMMIGSVSPSSTANGAFLFGSGYTPVAGQWPIGRDNVVWSPDATSNTRYVLYDMGGTHNADAATATGWDYNATFQLATGTVLDGSGANGVSRVGYNGMWSTNQSAFGAHDIALSGTDPTTGGPKFVDITRNMATYHTAFLGNAAATAWATATSYVVGDIVSAQSSGFYNNTVINYRCVTAHTSNAGNATNGQPGAAATTSWPTNWELASIHQIRLDVLAGTSRTVNGVSRNATRALYEWVQAGFAPRETALKNAAHDGTDIGAVAVISAAGNVGGPGIMLGF